jgi:hypothetical protein
VVEPDLLSSTTVTATRVTIRNASGETVQVSAPKVAAPGLSLKLVRQSVAPGAEAELIVEAANYTVVTADEQFSLDCSHSVEKTLLLPVEIRPKGGIRVDPPSVSFGVVRKAELLSRVIAISLEGDLLAEADAGSVRSPDYLVLRSINTGSPARRDLIFHVCDAFHASALGGTVVIPFRHRKTKRDFSVEVPISGFVRDDVGTSAAGLRQTSN